MQLLLAMSNKYIKIPLENSICKSLQQVVTASELRKMLLAIYHTVTLGSNRPYHLLTFDPMASFLFTRVSCTIGLATYLIVTGLKINEEPNREGNTGI